MDVVSFILDLVFFAMIDEKGMSAMRDYKPPSLLDKCFNFTQNKHYINRTTHEYSHNCILYGYNLDNGYIEIYTKDMSNIGMFEYRGQMFTGQALFIGDNKKELVKNAKRYNKNLNERFDGLDYLNNINNYIISYNKRPPYNSMITGFNDYIITDVVIPNM